MQNKTMTRAEKKAAEAAIKAEKKQADFETRERARKYPCTGGAQVITARPVGMDIATYKELRRTQQRQIKQYLRHGRLICKAAELYVLGADEVEYAFTKENESKGVAMKRTYPPYHRPKVVTKDAVNAALQKIRDVKTAKTAD